MHHRPFYFRILRASALLSLAVAHLHLQAASDLESLRDQYKDKVFVLRGFDQGARLTFDSGGLPTAGSADPGDWTVDGFVRVTGMDLSDQRLTIKAERLYLGVAGGMGFQLAQLDSKTDQNKNDKKGKDAKKLRIEVAVDPAGGTVEAALSKVFLTAEDHFAELVPDYWKPCVRAASTGRIARSLPDCRFSPEFAPIPGVVYPPEEKSGSQKADSDETAVDGEIVPSSDKSIVRAKVVRQLDPQFSEEARSAKYQGTINLAMVVDKTGQTRNIRIMRPIGMGLDQKAVEAVSRWQFEPALKDGEPVAMGPIQVQVDFHLY
jgi:TonB family protein